MTTLLKLRNLQASNYKFDFRRAGLFKTIVYIILFLMGLTAALWIGIYNGYPLVYPDTGAYIHSGFANKVPIDRPILYGLMIRHISMAESLWFVSIFQYCILSFSSYIFCYSFITKTRTFIATTISLVLLNALSSISYFTSQVMPDFFTGVLILNLLSFVLGEKKHRIPALLLCIIATGMHYSHLLLILFLSFTIIILSIRKSDVKIIAKRVILITLVAWLFLPMLQMCFGYGFNLSKAGHVFLMGRLMEAGSVSLYLQDSCKTTPNSMELCNYSSEIPNKAEAFWWQNNSPLYKGGCMEGNGEKCWLEKKEEYNRIINGIFSRWKYSKPFVVNSWNNTQAQITLFGVSEITSMMDGSPVWPQILWHYKNDSVSYSTTKQSLSMLNFNLFNKIIKVSFYTFFIFILLFLFRFKREKQLVAIFCYILVALLLNAMICSSLSCVADRFQSRVAWLIPFLGMMFIIKLISPTSKVVNEQEPV